LDYGRVELVNPDPRWAQLAKALVEEIEQKLGADVAEVEHIGSTAIPGLAAKPIIDIAVGVFSHGAVEQIKVALVNAGYLFRGDAGDTGGLVFVRERLPLQRIAHIHVVAYGERQWNDYLAFRDLLREDPEARKRYETQKRTLAREFANDRRAYTAAKSGVIEALLRAGRKNRNRSAR
jgi:GrpB-like predicted nucleotidyltransferase (UPF0157 family)